MEKVADNDKYSLEIDKKNNRIHLRIKGFWAVPSDVSAYVDDIKKAATQVTKGFTIITDVTEMKPPPVAVNKVHEEAQKSLIEAGLDRVAEIVSEDVLKKLVVDSLSKESGMKKKTFTNINEAIAWLDG